MTLYKIGSPKSAIIAQIQKALHLIPDGIYGQLTRDAVIEFQRIHGLTPDGIVGPATLAALIPARLKRSKRAITEIIIHCTATIEGKDYTIDDVRRWHTAPPPDGNGWSDIGYHYLIGRHGEVWEGRDVDIQGAHCAAGGHNRNSIGVCYVGGVSALNGKPKDTRTLAQKAALLNLLNDLLQVYPNAKVYGHRDFDKGKACPSFDAKQEYRLL